MANIKSYLDNIKNAMFGRDVRGSIHDGIDAINKEVEGTTNKQNALSEQFKNLVINAGESNAEVAASRGSHDWLPDRLDNFDSQLETKEKSDIFNIKNPPVPFIPLNCNGVNELVELQAMIDYCCKNNKVCYIPDNSEITLEGELWLPSNLNLKGEGKNSKLNFKTGQIRTEKDDVRNFGFVSNYANEVIPHDANDYNIKTINDIKSGSTIIQVDNVNGVVLGDILYTFNNIKNAWEILEDDTQNEKWNDFKNYPLGQMELFKIVEINNNTITLNRPILFDIPSNAPIRKLIGSYNINLSNFTIETNNKELLCEQIKDCVFEKLNLINTNLALRNKSYNNKIINNTIENNNGRCITISDFSSCNIISGNNCTWEKGGDSAILIMMSNGNTISNNIVNGLGSENSNQMGITIHARSYSNSISGNVVKGLSSGYGLYYGCYNNNLNGNACTNCLIDVNCYHCSTNEITSIVGFGSSRSGVKRSAYLYYSRNVKINNCNFDKDLFIENSVECFVLNTSINSENDGIVITGDLKQCSHIIKNNSIKALNKAIKIHHITAFDWEGFKPIHITDNNITAKIGLELKYCYYLFIDKNVIDCTEKCVDIIVGSGMNYITNNSFLNSTNGINFNNNLDASACCFDNNTFSKVANKIIGFVYPQTTTVSQIRGGIYGFKIYNIIGDNWSKYCVYRDKYTGTQSQNAWLFIE